MTAATPHSIARPEPTARWLATGEIAYRRMLEVIAGAQKSIRLETYIYRALGPGERFRAALTQAATRGVRVQVLLDGYGSAELPKDYWRELKHVGGDVRVFNPLSLRLFALRNHRKLLLVDDAVAIVGGYNIGPEYDGDGVTHGWRDLGLELHEAAALKPLAVAFDGMFRDHQMMHRFMRRLRQKSPWPRSTLPHDEVVLLSGPRLTRNEFRVALHHALRHAKHVQLISAYFVPSVRLRWALRRVARRGGTVELLLAGQTDVPLALAAGRSLYGSLLRAGVKIREFQPQVLHSKLAIVDDVVFAGSSNLDTRSFGINYELMVRLDDPRLATEARALFADHQEHAKAITWNAWRKSRTWLTRLRGLWARLLLTKVDPWLARRQLRGLS